MNLSPLACDYTGAMTEHRSPRPFAPDTEQLLDEWLVVRVQAGEQGAAEELARRWQPRLARTARRLLGEAEPALVVVQEAWVAILRGMGRLRDPARFAPFAFTILRRRCADAIRAHASLRGTTEDISEVDIQQPADQGEALAIRQAFAALPPDQRLAAQLFFVEGLTLAEIAEVQEVPLGTAKSRLFHARRQLKAALSDEQGDDE